MRLYDHWIPRLVRPLLPARASVGSAPAAATAYRRGPLGAPSPEPAAIGLEPTG